MARVTCPDCRTAVDISEGPSGGRAQCPGCERLLTVPPPLPAEAVLVPEVRPVEPESDPLDVLGFLVRLGYFLFAPIVFVTTCAMINQESLLVLFLLLTVLIGLAGDPTFLRRRFPYLDKVPLVGDGLRTLEALHAYYQEHRARSLLFYLFYPITSLALLPFSRSVRRELRLYAGILGAILVALSVEAFHSYSTTYPPHLGFSEAAGTVFARFLLSFGVVAGLLVPLTTTTIVYHNTGRTWQRRTLAAASLCMGLFAIGYYYCVIDTSMSLLSAEHLARRFRTRSFRAALRESTEMFLLYQVPRVTPDRTDAVAVQAELTKKYQALVGKLAVGDEAKGFHVVTIPAGGGRPWLGVWVRYLDAHIYAPHLIGAVSPEGVWHGTWARLPARIRGQFHVGDEKLLAERNWDPPINHVGKAMLIDDLP